MTGRPNIFDNNRPRYVYLHIGHGGQALYAGSTIHPTERALNHRYTSRWWPLVADIAVIGPFAAREALAIEREFIAELRPLFNIKGVAA